MCFKYWYVCVCERGWRLGSVGVVFNGIYFLRRCNWDKSASCSHLLQHSSLRRDCQGQRWEDADTSGNFEIISSMDKIFWFANSFPPADRVGGRHDGSPHRLLDAQRRRDSLLWIQVPQEIKNFARSPKSVKPKPFVQKDIICFDF